jgi:hypothetical protein
MVTKLTHFQAILGPSRVESAAGAYTFQMRWLVLVLLLPSAAIAAENDLSVAWIARNPKIDYVWDSQNPRVEGWPQEGSEVRWVANVRWLGADPVEKVAYRWLLDGETVATGTLDIPAGGLVKTEFPWTWTFSRHELVFEIDPSHQVHETTERNNRLLVHTNALGIAFYVERTFWNTLSGTARAAGIGATTYDDWVQRMVRHFNEMAQYSTYEDAPQGVLDRWRIDEIHLVEDGTLPLVPPYGEARDWGAGPQSQATLFPNVSDHTVDMQWGFPASSSTYYPVIYPAAMPWILVIGNSIIHELAHARTMIDTYAWSITGEGDTIEIASRPRATGSYIYSSLEHGLMHFDWGHIDRFTAVMMNLMAGQRARRGNYNEPWDLGWFLNDFPETNRVRFIRPNETPIPNATVRIYRPEPLADSSHPYAMRYTEPPDFTLMTDSDGWVSVPRNVISDDEITAFVDRTNGTAIVEIQDGPIRRSAFLESLQFNLAYWRGNRESAEYTVMADRPICNDSLGPSGVQPHPDALVTTGDVTFQLPVTPGRRYDFFYAVDGGSPNRLEVGPFTASPGRVTLPIPPGRVNWWFIDPNTAPCPPARSSIYGFDHDVKMRVRAVR